MNAKEAVKNLRYMSDVMMKVANKPEIYNTDYAYYLEQFSHQLYKDANELDAIESLLGMPSSLISEVA